MDQKKTTRTFRRVRQVTPPGAKLPSTISGLLAIGHALVISQLKHDSLVAVTRASADLYELAKWRFYG